jgi:hypothetical protein
MNMKYRPRIYYTNAIGEPFMAAHWTDPDFDASQSAFYYVRLIEIPTPRWTAYYGWINPASWHGGIPPASLVAITVFVAAYVANLLGRK